MQSKWILTLLLFIILTLIIAYSIYTSPADKTITLDLGGGVTLEMVKILAAGKRFTMGCSSTEQGSDANERPPHSVSFKKDYYIGKYEVTQGQWKALMNGANPSSFDGGDNYPVENVSWNDICDAGGFIKKLNTLKPSGYKNFRLPTEAEWEYAARAGTKTSFFWGSNSYISNNPYAWYNDNSPTHPVGEKLPNKFGLYDMSGNVWEWCNDWYGNYGSSAVTDPTGPTTGWYRIFRGGFSRGDASYCRSSCRRSDNPIGRHRDVGFRLVLPTSQ